MTARACCCTVGWTCVTAWMKIAWAVSTPAPSVAPTSAARNVAVTASGSMSRSRSRGERSLEISTLGSVYVHYVWSMPWLHTTHSAFSSLMEAVGICHDPHDESVWLEAQPYCCFFTLECIVLRLLSQPGKISLNNCIQLQGAKFYCKLSWALNVPSYIHVL